MGTFGIWQWKRACPAATPPCWPACSANGWKRLPTRLTPVSASTRSEEHTSELQSLMRISYAVFCLKKKKSRTRTTKDINTVIHSTHQQQSTNNKEKM